MAEHAELEVVTIEGREIRMRWRLARHGEWLAWCYVPADTQAYNEGVGYEVRAGTPEAAKAELLAKVRARVSDAKG